MGRATTVVRTGGSGPYPSRSSDTVSLHGVVTGNDLWFSWCCCCLIWNLVYLCRGSVCFHLHNGVYSPGSSLLWNCCLEGDYGVGLHCGHRCIFLRLIFRDKTVGLVPLSGKMISGMGIVDDQAGLL
jgi:hypothetical protein